MLAHGDARQNFPGAFGSCRRSCGLIFTLPRQSSQAITSLQRPVSLGMMGTWLGTLYEDGIPVAAMQPALANEVLVNVMRAGLSVVQSLDTSFIQYLRLTTLWWCPRAGIAFPYL